MFQVPSVEHVCDFKTACLNLIQGADGCVFGILRFDECITARTRNKGWSSEAHKRRKEDKDANDTYHTPKIPAETVRMIPAKATVAAGLRTLQRA